MSVNSPTPLRSDLSIKLAQSCLKVEDPPAQNGTWPPAFTSLRCLPSVIANTNSLHAAPARKPTGTDSPLVSPPSYPLENLLISGAGLAGCPPPTHNTLAQAGTFIKSAEISWVNADLLPRPSHDQHRICNLPASFLNTDFTQDK